MADPITLRLMTEHDLPLLHHWLNQPHVHAWWGGEEAAPSQAQVQAHYRPRVMAQERVTPYIAMWGARALGYAQSYDVMGHGDGWWTDETDPGKRGIDQFIGEAQCLDQGLGTRLVQALAARLFDDPAVTGIQTDPAPHNHRAIRCYEKAGFRRIADIVTPDGPAVYMLRLRSQPEPSSP
jgi:AacA4 family aminoglycoside N(6')-acetyltransferase